MAASKAIKAKAEEVRRKRKKEEREFGVFYDDDYDYMVHLKDRQQVQHDWDAADRFLIGKRREENKEEEESPSKAKERPKVKLPSSVFASEKEEEVGLLNRAAKSSGPLLDWDPDIVETLDDEYKHETVLTLKDEEEGEGERDELDDFIADAMAEGEGDDDDDLPSDAESFDSGEMGSERSFSDEETGSKFTQYSMSSSVVPRSENMQLLDDKFDKFFDDYLEQNMGGLDMDEIEGFRSESSEVMKQIMKEYEAQRASERQKPELVMTAIPEEVASDDDEDGRNKGDTDLILVENEGPQQEKWDCESILSTYSNIYHHPRLISEPSKKKSAVDPIKISNKTGMPKDVFGKGLTTSALKQLDRQNMFNEDDDNDGTATVASRMSELSVRNKHETTEEKRERKSALKELRRERRTEKKANKIAFKQEKEAQEKSEISRRRNTQFKPIM